MNQQYSQNDYLQAGLFNLDNKSMRINPQANQDIYKKSVNIGFNYFLSFKGQRVIITGASKGIGRCVAKTLLDAGAYVALVSKNKQHLESLSKPYPGLAFPFAYDISDPYELNVCFKKVVELFSGKIDILINCHAQYYCKNFAETTLKDWDDCMNENCRSMVHFTSLAVPFLETSEGNKSIVFLTQNVEDKPIPGELIYAVSKSMVNMFIQCLALELADTKVRVNGVASNFSASGYKVTNDIACTEMENKIFLDTVSEIKPLQNISKEKIPTNDEVANIILWLASGDSSFVTGEIITVDDGMSLTSTYPKLKSQLI